jgi:phosphoglycolate phosphatase-like HAD superfamily hydrolase
MQKLLRFELVAYLLLGSLLKTAHSFVLPFRISHHSSYGSLKESTSSSSDSININDNMYQKVKAVIFDVDGTLADSWKLGFDATMVVLDKNNIPSITEEIYHDGTRYATPERLARHAGLTPTHPDFEERGNALGKEFDDLYVGLVSLETAGFYPGIETLLTNIPSDVALGALTNAAVRYAYAVLEKNCPTKQLQEAGTSATTGTATGNLAEIYSRFGSIRGADNVPKPKPAPDGLFQVCQDLGLAPEDCVYIGDSPSDGAAAHAAGMPSIGVLWGSHKEESLRAAPFTHICKTVEELRFLLPR